MHKITRLKDLYDKSYETLSTNKNLTVQILENLMNSYDGDDWKKYIKKDIISKSYYKNLVYSSELLDMYIITWSINSESCIHDHPENGCMMKILSGELEENEYANISESISFIKTNVFREKSPENIGFKIGNELLHKIRNISDKCSVSLHLYSKGNYIMNSYKLK